MGERVVIGVGNPLRGDDAAGPAVIERLRGHVPEGVALRVCDGEPAELLEALNGAERAVFVDAVCGGGEPGELHVFDAAAAPLPAVTGSPSTHGLGLAEALELGRALGRLPQRVVVVGIEAAGDDHGEALSAPVAAAIDAAAALVLEELDRDA